jgi:hypothetical protein
MPLTFPRDLRAGLFLKGQWRDATSAIRQTPPVAITHGVKDEAGKASPSSCSLSLSDPVGEYDPNNPTGPWYGHLGVNTPLRLGLLYGLDEFDRVSGAGLGTSPTMGAWSSFQSAGTVASNIASGEARHQVTSTSAFIANYLDDVSLKQVDVSATFHFDTGFAVAGGDIEPCGLIVRGITTSQYYMLRVSITSTQAIQLRLMVGSSQVLFGPVTVGTFSGTTAPLSVRFQADGNTFRGKLWDTAAGEPYAWQLEYSHGDVFGAGWVGVRSGVGAGNSNSKPINVLIDSYTVSIPRFAGEIAEIIPDLEPGHANRRVAIKATGILRRLRQGNAKLDTAYRRWVDNGPYTNVEYYPLDDDVTSNTPGRSLVSGRQAEVQLSTVAQPGGVKWGDDPKRLSLDKVVTIGADSAIQFALGGSYNVDYAFTWTHKLPVKSRFAMVMNLTHGDYIYILFNCDAATTGYEAGRMIVQYVNVSGISTTLLSHIPPNWTNDDNQWYDCGISIRRNIIGGITDFGVLFSGKVPDLRVISHGALVPGQPDRLMYNVPGIYLDGIDFIDTPSNIVSIGQLATWDADLLDVLGGSDLATWTRVVLSGYDAETAGSRHARIMTEKGLPYGHVGYPTESPQMGGQSRQTTSDIAESCSDVTLSMPVFDARGSIGLILRNNRSMINQSPAVTLDYAAGQLGDALLPTTDDQGILNSFTAKRPLGGEYSYARTTGPRNTGDPGADPDAVGEYEKGATLNVQRDNDLPDQASFRVNLGTVAKPRYPSITVKLRAREVATTAGLAEALMDVGPGDLMRIVNASSVFVYDDVDLIVRGYTETFVDARMHNIRFNTTPAEAFTGLVLDNSSTGRLDTGSTTTSEALDTTETGVDVAHANTGDAFVATGYPFDIMIGGERMTATAGTAGASSTTLTVVRSVNGVVKSHDTGAPVHIVSPNRIVL